jgi:hypothetical protein
MDDRGKEGRGRRSGAAGSCAITTSAGTRCHLPAVISSPLRPPQPRPGAYMALEEAIEVLKIAASIAEVIPVLGTPIKAAIEATSNILEFAKVRVWWCRQVKAHGAQNSGFT